MNEARALRATGMTTLPAWPARIEHWPVGWAAPTIVMHLFDGRSPPCKTAMTDAAAFVQQIFYITSPEAQRLSRMLATTCFVQPHIKKGSVNFFRV